MILLYIFLFIAFYFNGAIAQESTIPGLGNKDYNNTVTYDFENKICRFNYSGRDCNIDYIYDVTKGYSFNGIQAVYKNSTYYPSFFGGVSVKDQNNNNYYSWSEGIEFENINTDFRNNSITTEWIMKKGDDFYYHYNFQISISGKSLIIKVKDLGKIDHNSRAFYSNCFSFQLDRCENVSNPVIVKIPYLTTFGILYSNGLFTSMFFDWTKTNSSQIYAENKKISEKSVYYSQNSFYYPKTNGKYNPLEETIYITASPEITETFPNIPNPVARYKDLSVKHVVFDNWDEGFKKIQNNTQKLLKSGYEKLWLIIHNWQNGGYDNKLPEVLPSNSNHGGDAAMKKLSLFCRTNKILFSLHENYTDFYTNGIYYKIEDVGLTPDGEKIKAWKNSYGQSYLMKPSRMQFYIDNISKKVHQTFNSNSSFIDVIAARNPSDYIDYDHNVLNAGKFAGTYNNYKNTGNILREIHKGPVSSEGYNHFLYIGYFDDITPQIQTTDEIGANEKSGYYLPLIVDFDLLKMHDKTMVHGVGYLERFFHKGNYWQHMGRSRDSLLIYSATEIAYGHGGFIQSNSYNYEEMARLEYIYVYPMQLLYGNSRPVRILYNLNNTLVSLSDYIKKFPNTFDKFNSKDFLSQVFVEYQNGVKVFVNRHPGKSWKIKFDKNVKGWFNYNALIKNKKVLKRTGKNPGKITLPVSNGWFCYSPQKPDY